MLFSCACEKYSYSGREGGGNFPAVVDGVEQYAKFCILSIKQHVPNVWKVLLKT